MNDDQARVRFLAIQMLRLTGVALAIFGVAIIAGKVDLPVEAGYVFLLVGVFDAVAMPVILARKWKTPLP